MMRFARVALAIILAPVTAPVVFFAYACVFLSDMGHGVGEVAFYMVPSTYAAMIAFGIPTHFLLRRAQRTGLPAYLGWGICLGIVGNLLSAVLSDGFIPVIPSLLVAYSAVGTVVGISFWLIASPDLAPARITS